MPVLASSSSILPSARWPAVAAAGFCGAAESPEAGSLPPCAAWACATNRRLEVALCVDQEIGGDHDLLAILHAVNDFDVVVAACPELDLARLEAALTKQSREAARGTGGLNVGGWAPHGGVGAAAG